MDGLDCANSSDALLMNIFCHRRTVASRDLSSMLGIAPGLAPAFGFRPGIPLRNGRTDRTEIDMKLRGTPGRGEADGGGFSKSPCANDERYRDIDEVFAFRELKKSGDVVSGYQLIRGVLAAHATCGSFCIFLRRTPSRSCGAMVFRDQCGTDLHKIWDHASTNLTSLGEHARIQGSPSRLRRATCPRKTACRPMWWSMQSSGACL
jgi:hypothetical protein